MRKTGTTKIAITRSMLFEHRGRSLKVLANFVPNNDSSENDELDEY